MRLDPGVFVEPGADFAPFDLSGGDRVRENTAQHLCEKLAPAEPVAATS
jgi:hypothetical protein